MSFRLEGFLASEACQLIVPRLEVVFPGILHATPKQFYNPYPLSVSRSILYTLTASPVLGEYPKFLRGNFKINLDMAQTLQFPDEKCNYHISEGKKIGYKVYTKKLSIKSTRIFLWQS